MQARQTTLACKVHIPGYICACISGEQFFLKAGVSCSICIIYKNHTDFFLLTYSLTDVALRGLQITQFGLEEKFESIFFLLSCATAGYLHRVFHSETVCLLDFDFTRSCCSDVATIMVLRVGLVEQLLLVFFLILGSCS